jgi:hypothetical protein
MKKLVLIALVCTLPLALHAQVLMSYDKTEGVDFTAFKTFKVYSLDVNADPDLEPKREGLNYLVEEVNRQMVARGYQKVMDNPDLLINLGVTIAREQQTRETDISDAPMYIGQRSYHWESEEVVVRNYTSGTVVMDLVDAGNNEMVWQAVSKGILSSKQEKNKKVIQKGVQKLFKKFPVKVSK